jgi:plasmid stabilization system protein ParE
MIAYDFRPEVLLDLDEIWEFIRGDNLDAAGRVIAEILTAIDAIVPFPGRGHRRCDCRDPAR